MNFSLSIANLRLTLLVITSFSVISYAQIDHWETAVYETDSWKYFVPDADVDETWTTLAFDDGAWLTGIGGFGFDDGDDNTILLLGTISVFQRIEFTIVDTAAIELALLHVDYDDGFVAYLNGQEIARELLDGAGQPAWNQFTTDAREATMYTGGVPAQYILPKEFLNDYLIQGTNVLCIQTHNATLESTDLSSRVFLSLGITDSSSNYGTPPAWFEMEYSNLPIIVITTVSPIVDEPKVAGTMGIIHNESGANSLLDPFNEFYGEIGIELRGSSSATFPKKAYRFETRGPDSTNYNVSVFDFPVDNDWVLYAPYADKSLIRNVLTYKLGAEMGHYAPRTQLVELYLNHQYVGVYVFLESVKQSPGRVNIDELNYTDTTGNALTGGYVFKLDRGPAAWTSPYGHQPPASGVVQFQMQDPDISEMHPTQLNYLKNYVTAFEDALFGPDFTDPELGYRKYIDVRSFIDFMLVNEMTGNLDAYRVSSFFYKEQESIGGKMVAGPIWDFNLGWGNCNFCLGESVSVWKMNSNSYCYGDGEHYVNRWWSTLLSDPEFSHEFNCRWQELRLSVLNEDSILAYIDEMEIYLADAAAHNFERWPILGSYVWPNNYIGATYSDEMDYLGEWMIERFAWMDANMFGSCEDLGVEDDYQVEFAHLYPNPTTGATTLILKASIANGHIAIINHLGQLIDRIELTDQNRLEIDLTEYDKGLYILQIYSNNQLISNEKIIRN